MKLFIAFMLSAAALTCSIAQAEDGSTRLQDFHEMHQQNK